jgi:hypothetical protein
VCSICSRSTLGTAKLPHACRLWFRHPSVGVFRLGAVQQPHPTTQHPTGTLGLQTLVHHSTPHACLNNTASRTRCTDPPSLFCTQKPATRLPNSMGHTQSTLLHLHTADPDLHATTVTAARCSSTWGGQHLQGHLHRLPRCHVLACLVAGSARFFSPFVRFTNTASPVLRTANTAGCTCISTDERQLLCSCQSWQGYWTDVLL